MRWLKTLLKEIQFRTPVLRTHWSPRWLYGYNPAQLIFLCQCLDQTRDVHGEIAEIGCATGWTTLFLTQYLETQGSDKPRCVRMGETIPCR